MPLYVALTRICCVGCQVRPTCGRSTSAEAHSKKFSSRPQTYTRLAEKWANWGDQVEDVVGVRNVLLVGERQVHRVTTGDPAEIVVRVQGRVVPIMFEIDRAAHDPAAVDRRGHVELVALIFGAMEVGQVATCPRVGDAEVAAVSLD